MGRGRIYTKCFKEDLNMINVIKEKRRKEEKIKEVYKKKTNE